MPKKINAISIAGFIVGNLMIFSGIYVLLVDKTLMPMTYWVLSGIIAYWGGLKDPDSTKDLVEIIKAFRK